MNNNYVAPKDQTVLITAVGGGGGGSSFLGGGGGSGYSCFKRSISLKKGDTLSFIIGSGGAGNSRYSNSYVSNLPNDSSTYNGSSGGYTIIKLNNSNIISLSGGGGATTNPAIVKVNGGVGENRGNIINYNMTNSAQDWYYSGGNGAPSIFGAGGSGGYYTFAGDKTNGNDALSFGAGGGGGALLQMFSSGYKYTSAGDGMQGVVLMDVI